MGDLEFCKILKGDEMTKIVEKVQHSARAWYFDEKAQYRI